MKKAIFFDRDGVLNEAIIKNNKPYAPLKRSDVKLVYGVKELIFKLKSLDFLILAVTNQPDYRRGLVKKNDIEDINNFIIRSLDIDDLFCCYHDDRDNCGCRKPKPGAILFFQKKYNIDLKKSFLIGDRSKDIQAAHAVNCPAIFIDYGYNESLPNTQIANVNNIPEIFKVILKYNGINKL